MSLPSINRTSSRVSIIAAVVAIITGGAIYILLRPAKPLFFQWIKWAGFEDQIFLFRQATLPFSPAFPDWFVYSLPGGLWAFSYSLFILLIWKNSNSLIRYFWYTTVPVLIFGFEIIQYIEVIPGTFCLIDIAFSSTGILTAFILGYKSFKSNNHGK